MTRCLLFIASKTKANPICAVFTTILKTPSTFHRAANVASSFQIEYPIKIRQSFFQLPPPSIPSLISVASVLCQLFSELSSLPKSCRRVVKMQLDQPTRNSINKIHPNINSPTLPALLRETGSVPCGKVTRTHDDVLYEYLMASNKCTLDIDFGEERSKGVVVY